MINPDSNNQARKIILESIRDNLLASAPRDAIHDETTEHNRKSEQLPASCQARDSHRVALATDTSSYGKQFLIDQFKENLEDVDGHCIVVCGAKEVRRALNKIVTSLHDTPLRVRRIALSDAPLVQHLTRELELEVEEITVSPDSTSLFSYDLGITMVQAAIAETGTLVLESECERHRLVSLVPPIHIAIVESGQICLTLGEALEALRSDSGELNSTITFITGPSRTADIELTLAIGVHGPQKLFVIVNTGFKLEAAG